MIKSKDNLSGLKIWDKGDQKTLQYRRYKKIHSEGNIYELCFDKDNLIASEDTDITFNKFQGNHHQQQESIQGVHFYLVYTFCFSQTNTWFISGGHDRKIKIWHLDQNGKWLCTAELKGHKDSILCLILTKDEKQIISRSRDKTIKIWNNDGEKWTCIKTIQALSGVVDSLSLNKQTNELVFGCKQSLAIWKPDQLQQWKKYSQITQAHNSIIQSVSHIESKSQIISGASEIKIWNQNYQNGCYREISQIITSGKVGIMQFNEQLSVLFTVANKKYVEIWKISSTESPTKQQTIEANKNHDYYYEEDQDFVAMNVSKDGKFLALKDNHSDEIEIWKLK